jgi:hypothetical protein|tara:strand:- start:2449 stop:5148 length:2700 start_codon:yes stop_codon:yes gene_type:complete
MFFETLISPRGHAWVECAQVERSDWSRCLHFRLRNERRFHATKHNATRKNSEDSVESEHYSNPNKLEGNKEKGEFYTRRNALAGGTALAVCTPGHNLMSSFYSHNGTADASEFATEWSVADGRSELHIINDGTIILSGPHPNERRQSLRLKLPDRAAIGPARGFTGQPGDPDGVALSIQWPGGVQLQVWRASSMRGHHMEEKFKSWAHGIDQGYFLEFILKKESLTNQSTVCGAEIALELSDGVHWFGGAHMLRQIWPLDRAQWEIGPLYPFDHGPNGLGSVVGCHWVSSRGSVVMVDPRTPLLHFGLNSPTTRQNRMNPRYFGVGVQHLAQPTLPATDPAQKTQLLADKGDGLMHIQARTSWEDRNVLHPWQTIDTSDFHSTEPSASRLNAEPEDCVVLRLALAAKGDPRNATVTVLRSFRLPSQPPPSILFERAIWTTWATSHADVTQSDVLALSRNIIKYGFRPGVLEVDDRWQVRYGDLIFDPEKFPDPKQMVNNLHDLGFLVTVWVTPFFQEGSAAYREAIERGYLVKGRPPPTVMQEISVGGVGQRFGSAVKVLVDEYDWPPGHWEGGGGGGQLRSGQLRWWGTQPVGVLDLTDNDAVDWYVARLKRFQAIVGIDGFKFDAGEPCFLPSGAVTSRPLQYPGEYTQLWVTNVASNFPVSEVRSAYSTTEYSGLIRMGDRDTVWGLDNGLQSLIPTLLTSAVLGYPFCLPDMVGGNAYWGQYPDTELMVRWAQVSAMMPAVQWSIPPWDISDTALKACLATERAREAILLPRLPDLVRKASRTLVPICRPLWWLDPTDEETFAIDDQFLIGDDVIVAPVVQEGARWRKVYLPRGEWIQWVIDSHGMINDIGNASHEDGCLDTKRSFIGPCWIVVDAPLEILPIFINPGPCSETML